MRDDFNSYGSTEMKCPLKHGFCSPPPRNQARVPPSPAALCSVDHGALWQQIEEQILICSVLLLFNLLNNIASV